MTHASWRRLIHAATASVVLVDPLLSSMALRVATLAVAVLALGADLARLRSGSFHAWLTARIPVFRPPEATRLSGATWLWVGYGIAAWAPAAVPAILVGALADPAASAVGERLGRPGRKTWAGSVAFFVVAAAIALATGLGWRTALAAAGVGALVERWAGRLDDNLMVAPAVALAIWVLP